MTGSTPSSGPRHSGWRGLPPVLATTSFVVAALVALLLSPRVGAQDGITLGGLRGESFSEAELSRGPTIVVVWASWSPRGQDVVPRVNALNRGWGSKGRVVAVNFQEDRATIERFLSSQSFQVPVLLDEDGAFAKKYAVTSLPGLLVFRDGQKAFGGRLPEEPDRVLAEIFP